MSEAQRSAFRMEISDLLPRLRQTVTLHTPFTRLYRSAFTPALADWFLKAADIGLGQSTIPQTNLHRITRRSSIIHFGLDSGVPQTAQVFWVRAPSPLVCPSNRFVPLALDPAVAGDSELVRWITAAVKLDEEIQAFTDAVYDVAPTFTRRSDIAAAWPEIVHAVPSLSYSTKADPARVRTIRKQVEKYFPPDAMARFTDMLATAVMLPADAPLQAWIGVNKEDFDGTP